ncbi:MAG: DNA primase, partial [Nitrospinaceae bacterium]
DRFRGRLMFPIADAQGRIIGFGGRTLDADGEPKYINSPETPVYVKGRHLYGLHLAKEPVRHRDHVLIVEGYFDVIRCFQAGVENVVAACGTALTAQQARTLRGFTQNAVLMYDADAAGQTAAERSFAVLIEQGMQIRVAALPPGHDPDSFLQEHGRDAFLEQVNRAPLFPLYFLDRCIAQGDPNSLEGKTEILNHLLPVLARIPNSVERAEWVRQTAERLKIEDRALLQELKKTLSQNRTRVTPPKPQGSPQAFDPERFLALLMLEEETAARRIREQVSLEEFTDPKYRELARLVFVELDAGRPVRAHSLVDQTDMPEVKAELARLALASLTFDNPKRAVDECAANLRKRAIAGKIKDLKTKRNQAHKAGLGEQTQRIHQELRRLQESLILI